jgi:hypothetical protein
MSDMSAHPAECRRALARLAASPTGVSEEMLIAQGFPLELIVELVRSAYVERVVVNGRAMPLDLIRITEAGWQLLVSP